MFRLPMVSSYLASKLCSEDETWQLKKIFSTDSGDLNFEIYMVPIRMMALFGAPLYSISKEPWLFGSIFTPDHSSSFLCFFYIIHSQGYGKARNPPRSLIFGLFNVNDCDYRFKSQILKPSIHTAKYSKNSVEIVASTSPFHFDIFFPPLT